MELNRNLHTVLHLLSQSSFNRIKFFVVLIVLILGLTTKSYSKNFYFSSSTGNDSHTGTQAQNPDTPWKTIDQFNKSMNLFTAGDFLLFKRGDTFVGTITISKSGTSGNPIVIGAYGTGNDPIISGFTTITGWTNEGGGLYSKVITSSAQTNMVTIDGVPYGMGRYPDVTYLYYESFSSNVSITDHGLGDATDWAGAEVVIRKNDYVIDRCAITDHTVDVLTYTNFGTTTNATTNYGYFIQNDLRCVTTYGEWYHDYAGLGKFYMYFGAVDPTTKTVKVATINSLIYNEGYDYITIGNISFNGSIQNGISLGSYWGVNSDYCTIQNCSISFSGADGIYLPTSCDHAIIDKNSINHSSRAGIFAGGGNGNIITNNVIKNSCLIAGGADRGTWGDGIYFSGQTNGLVQYNDIDKSGSNGIFLIGNGIEIRNNFINNSIIIT